MPLKIWYPKVEEIGMQPQTLMVCFYVLMACSVKKYIYKYSQFRPKHFQTLDRNIGLHFPFALMFPITSTCFMGLRIGCARLVEFSTWHNVFHLAIYHYLQPPRFMYSVP